MNNDWAQNSYHQHIKKLEMNGRSFITQYGSSAYLGMIQVASGQFLFIENIRCSAMAKRDRKEPKECHSSTKGELVFSLITSMHA